MHISFEIRIKNIIFLLIVLLSISRFVSAEEAQPVSLSSLIKEALDNNPEIRVMQAQLEAARLKIPQASALPDPMAGYTVMGPDMIETRVGPQEDMYEFEQSVPFPGKLIEKRRIARAEAESAEAALNKTKQDVVFKLSEVYYDFYAMEESLKSLEEVHTLLLGFARTAESFYAGMKGSQKDVSKANIEATEVLQRRLLLEQQKNSLLEMLRVLINRQVTEEELQPLPVLGAVKENFELEKLIEQAQKNRPELKEAGAMLASAKHANRLAKYEYAPDFSVGFQYYSIGDVATGDPNDGEDAWMIPVRFTIPLWQNRIVPALKEAKQNLNASQDRLENAENMSIYEVKNAYYKFETSKEVVVLYEGVLLPQAELALRSSMAEYESGNTDFINLIDSERVYLNAKIAYYQAVADNFKNFAALERAVGLSLTALGEEE